MGGGRIPGPYGRKQLYGCVWHRGSLGFDEDWFDSALHITPGPIGMCCDLASKMAIPDPASDDEAELKLLVEVFGGVRASKESGQSYTFFKKRKKQYRVKEYVRDRNNFFGSAEQYKTYKENARQELEAENGKLRKYIEPPPATRKNVTDWKDAQDVFYSWTRKAFQKQVGDQADFPKVIKTHKSEKLEKALAQVRSDYEKAFKSGGFNPRPMKLGGAYRLGTISDHAFGTAVDIEDATNAQIPRNVWLSILKFTGKSLNHSTALAKWKSAPKELHDAITEINNEFVSRLAKLTEETIDAAEKKAARPNATQEDKLKAKTVKANPLEALMAADENLKKIGLPFLQRWQNGFFNLPWDLVKELHEEDLLWGATFTNPDLHHFQL